MATIKSYTDIEQSRKLADILPLESADMTLPFRHPKNDEYIPGYVVSRNYVEVYNEMMKLPAMEKEDVCQLIQPAWSLASLLNVIKDECGYFEFVYLKRTYDSMGDPLEDVYRLSTDVYDVYNKDIVDTCYEMIIKLKDNY